MATKPGGVLTEAKLNQDDVLAVGRVVFQATRAATQSIVTATLTPVQFDTVAVDVLTAWAGGAPSRITPDVAGYYVVSGAIGYQGSNSGVQRQAVWWKNGASINGGMFRIVQSMSASEIPILARTIAIPCNGSTDYIELVAYHDKGSALNLTSTAEYVTHITITYGGAL